MPRNIRLALLAALACMLAACVDFGASPQIAVVDTARILAESAPAKAGEAHLQQVHAVLQKGLDDVQALYKGKEQSPEAQQAVREAHTALERQLTVERQAVLHILGNMLDRCVKQWRVAYPTHSIVISKQMLLDSDNSLDVTPAIMTEMNAAQPVFPPLPTVTVNTPQSTQNTTPPEAHQRKR